MRRALGGEVAPKPPLSPQPKPKTTPVVPAAALSRASPQAPRASLKKDPAPKQDSAKGPETKKPPPLVKHLTLQGLSPAPAKEPAAAEPPSQPGAPPGQAKAPTAHDRPKQPPTGKPATDSQPSVPAAGKPECTSSVQPQAAEQAAPPANTESTKPSQSCPPAGQKVTPLDSKAMPRPAADSKIISLLGPSSESRDQKQADPVPKKEEPKMAQTQMSPKPEAQPMPKGSATPPGPRAPSGQTAPTPLQPSKPQEQSRRFSLSLGGTTDTPKSQPTTPQESVTGKLFGLGASIFSQASNLISTAGQPGLHSQGGPAAPSKQAAPPSQAPASQGPPKPTGQAAPAPGKGAPVKKETKTPMAEKAEPKAEPAAAGKRAEADKKRPLAKESRPPAAEPRRAVQPPTLERAPKPKAACPLCRTELSVGPQGPPNFNICTECKSQVCNLCGFNPMPHLTEVSSTA
ncbi:Protein piccolo [Heterocephalus glaber]|uniref:Protein piccolo n=1 Tax=Heterocephalus glaber TaxID=10181 RepID=G5B0R5_HETGA|nr:Protein piccolo [Heterocephalus glaber]